MQSSRRSNERSGEGNSPASSMFCYEGLTSLLREISCRFRVLNFAQWQGGPGVILRHDVDLDIEPAYRLSQLEEKCGVGSSYFIMTASATYNPGTLENRALLRDMVDRGFDIGLHFDPTIYGDISSVQLQARCEAEAAWLSSIVGTRVVSVSLHNPSVHGQYPLFDGFRNAYAPDVFSPDTYWSESRMLPRKPLREILNAGDHRPVQILMHPFHFSPSGQGYRGHFWDYLRRHAAQVDRTFGESNCTYREAFPDGLAPALTLMRSFDVRYDRQHAGWKLDA